MTSIRSAWAIAASALLAACATDMTGPTLEVTTPGTMARQFDCVETAADGTTCNKKQCKSGPGGFTFYCDTYAYYCVKAGHKWEGTRDLGICTRMHPN